MGVSSKRDNGRMVVQFRVNGIYTLQIHCLAFLTFTSTSGRKSVFVKVRYCSCETERVVYVVF